METKNCLKCGHNWVSRVGAPKECPHCKSYKWNEDVKENVTPEGGCNANGKEISNTV